MILEAIAFVAVGALLLYAVAKQEGHL